MFSYPPSRICRVGLAMLFLSIVLTPFALAPLESRSQGLTAQTEPYLVKDIYSQTLRANPSHTTAWNGALYFSADDGIHGYELWKSDGTDAGTVMVKDIFAGAVDSNPSSLQPFQDRLYFITADHRGDRLPRRALWTTDGTGRGTKRILNLGSSFAWIEGATSNRLFFFYDDGVHGRELWALAGPDSQPYMVKDITPEDVQVNASAASEAEHARSVAVDDYLYFFIDDGVHGYELWRSDGSEAGTQLVVDATPGPESSDPTSKYEELIVSESSVYFHSSGSRSYWKVDGDSAKKIVALAANSGHTIGQLIAVHQGKAYLSVVENGMDPGAGLGKLWVSAGRRAVKLQDVYHKFDNADSAGTAVGLGNIVYLRNISTDEEFENVELWRTDGTAEGTAMVADIMPGKEGSVPIDLIAYQDHIYFFAYDEVHGTEFWRTDGTASGTELVKDLNEGPDSSWDLGYREYQPALVGDTLFFAAYDNETNSELWRSDGSAEGTQRVKDINTTTGHANPDHLTPVGDRLFFTAEFPTRERWYNGQRRTLWYTDGTEAGTSPVIDFEPYAGDHFYYELLAAGERLFVTVQGYADPTPYTPYDDKTEFVELWVIEGASPSATRLASWKGLNEYWDMYETAILNGRFYGILAFEDNRDAWRQIWTSDGTVEGTTRGPDMPCSDFARLRAWNGWLYCVGLPAKPPSDGSQVYQLWKNNGANDRVLPVTGVPVDMVNGVELDGYLYFGGYEPMTSSNNGNVELWRSDGTAKGSMLVKEIKPPTSDGFDPGSNPRALTVVKDRIFFLVDDETDGEQLWVTDGTTDGTKRVTSNDAFNVDEYADTLGGAIGNNLYFAGGPADSANVGSPVESELWRSNGFKRGTGLFSDLLPGPEHSSHPANFTAIADLLYFTADDPPLGLRNSSLWATDGTAEGTRRAMMIQEADAQIDGSPGIMQVVGDRLYFTAYTRAHGLELWTAWHGPEIAPTPTPTPDANANANGRAAESFRL